MDEIMAWLQERLGAYISAYSQTKGALKELGKVRIETIEGLIEARKREIDSH